MASFNARLGVTAASGNAVTAAPSGRLQHQNSELYDDLTDDDDDQASSVSDQSQTTTTTSQPQQTTMSLSEQMIAEQQTPASSTSSAQQLQRNVATPSPACTRVLPCSLPVSDCVCWSSALYTKFMKVIHVLWRLAKSCRFNQFSTKIVKLSYPKRRSFYCKFNL